MTQREFLTAIANGTTNEEIMEYAVSAIAKMDVANEKRKNAVSKKALENQPLVDRIVNEILGTEPITATDVAAVLECSVQKASALLRGIVADGHAVAEDVKVPGKGKAKAYRLA